MKTGYFVVIERTLKIFDPGFGIMQPPFEIIAYYNTETEALTYARAISSEYYKVRVVLAPLVFDGGESMKRKASSLPNGQRLELLLDDSVANLPERQFLDAIADSFLSGFRAQFPELPPAITQAVLMISLHKVLKDNVPPGFCRDESR